ncbi:helix-turn-helix domain-containing protein [Streptococcus pyogenes]|uniref:helix-turn-helix domain-containing protein n=1 Tax=Streptococcus pyogenes TaxID=1314 RepID=UPI00109BC75B|nr:helix-turn-helix transcriptional regulator [Streptococcus pyogenes]VGQ61475.1 immunity repressor protein - phage associated [Streptococcus pyogenes]VGQ65379.1 immunity repressor protein - phage associated [Streptococcus pyogenes]VHB03150.1 immunity repressor protein - phage associated [Streptococcus pyogenes]VHC13377.1 immunity repressor protein - phage associated [Streptococcus pyogenes]VHC86360.1 immunity repressor protein - phage associated [Streptococcus pyogenes]
MKLRIKYLRQALGLTQSAFAAKAHVHKNMIANYFLTFILHFIVIDWIWKALEIAFLGKINGNDADSILLILLCLYITWTLE